MKLTQKAVVATQRVLIYGAPKTGKTELAARLAEHYQLLWFDLENGYTTMLKLPREWQERIELISIPDSRVFPIAIETLMKVVKGTEVNICEAHGKVSCAVCTKEKAPVVRVCLNEIGSDTIVVFDSLTQFTNSGIAHITKTQPDDYKLQLDDWGALRVLMDKFLSQIQVARYNVVCITHEEEVVFEDGKKKIVPVCGSANSSRNTAKYFDHVVYLEMKNRKHVAGSMTNYATNAVTGSRTDISLEDSKSASASLLDIFTGWKSVETGRESNANTKTAVDNIAITTGSISVNSSISNTNTANTNSTPAGSTVTGSKEIALTPGQIALNNLKAKQAAAKYAAEINT